MEHRYAKVICHLEYFELLPVPSMMAVNACEWHNMAQFGNGRIVSVCVCVPPWTKGLTPPLFLFYTGRGAMHD